MHTTSLPLWVFSLVLTVAPAALADPAPTSTPGAQEQTLTPGTVIDSSNAAKFARVLPAAARTAIDHGFKILVKPTERLEWSAGFEKATEKYSPQVTLDAHDYLTNYVAGMPFPLVDPKDPKAAAKIAYNWHMGPVMPDDFSLAPWSSNGYQADAKNPDRFVTSDKNDNDCDQFEFLRFAHRTEVDPRPTIGANAMGVEWKAKCTNWSLVTIGANVAEGAGIWIRYLDPKHADEFYGFDETTRRIHRIAVTFEYPTETCRTCHQPYWAYALPKTEDYTYRLLGVVPIFACMNADDEPAGIKPSESEHRLSEEPFQLREAYILEMTPAAGAHTNLRDLVYIDTEIYVWLAAEFFESGQLTATTIPLWRMRPSPEGGNLFDLAGSFYFPAGQPGLLRSVVPAHDSFTQKINTGEVSEGAFIPQLMH